MSFRLASLIAVAAASLLVQPAIADPARRAAHEQLRQDRHARHDAREQLHRDKAAGDHDAVVRDKAVLEAAKAKVEADKAALKSLRAAR